MALGVAAFYGPYRRFLGALCNEYNRLRKEGLSWSSNLDTDIDRDLIQIEIQIFVEKPRHLDYPILWGLLTRRKRLSWPFLIFWAFVVDTGPASLRWFSPGPASYLQSSWPSWST